MTGFPGHRRCSTTDFLAIGDPYACDSDDYDYEWAVYDDRDPYYGVGTLAGEPYDDDAVGTVLVAQAEAY